MAQAKTTIMIDKVKLKKLVKDYCQSKGITVTDLARELGFSDSYFSDVWDRGTIRQFVINWLDRECGIKYDAYKLNPKPVQTLTKEETQEYLTKMESSDELANIASKIDELNVSINRLGNILMQELEYVKELKDMLK